MNLGWTETKLNRLFPKVGTEDPVRTILESRQSLSVSGIRPIVRAWRGNGRSEEVDVLARSQAAYSETGPRNPGRDDW